MFRVLAVLPVLLVGLATPAVAQNQVKLDNGLAATPPMGWNDWNAFGCGVDQQLVEQTADTLVSSGMRDAGYTYVNIDDCWALPDRNANGDLVADPAKFPDGIAKLADYVHARGLKLGIYEDSGTHTCSKSGGFPGSLGHEQQDAALFASWHVDYLKYDDCNVPTDGQNVEATIARYNAMRDALAGKGIVFSICEKTDFGVPNSAWPTVGNLWRTTGDIHDNYARMVALFHTNVTLADLAGPNRWNDPDMLEIGNGGMSDTEYRSHFALWAEMAAPLIAGTELRTMSAATKEILTNREIIAVDQDPLGAQGRAVAQANGQWVLTKPLADGSRAVTLFNETDAPATITTTAAQTGLGHAFDYQVRDLFAHTTSESAGQITAALPAHASAMYRISPNKRLAPPHVTVGLSSVDAANPTTVTATVTNDGLLPAVWNQLHLTLPAGWSAQPFHDELIPVVPANSSRSITYQLKPPAITTPLPTDQLTITLNGKQSFTEDLHRPTPVAAPLKTFAAVDGTTRPQFGQLGDRLAIIAAGADVSGTNNQYGTIYQPQGLNTIGTATTQVTQQQNRNASTKSGLIVRSDLTKADASPGYVTLEVTPSKGVQFQWDANGDGQLDSAKTVSGVTAPVWLRITRDGTAFTGQYSVDGATWNTIATITVPSAVGPEDVGVFTSSHNKYVDGRADFGSLTVG
ncbi:NEW3 domain-containing protein [Kutzneria sp. CA-103260]|uniref:NEW3 domain-containing protein n=1 Tax=Kutzneria sp. CA-103260 TaxID=2802641 RepID=UPI001BAA85C8|nr:NEW3 domain-containing protein [Kutzneria sp. CA-103260]QUQ65071.1 Alpha galactosidase A [Kutzneria sp. CA-103260]